MLLNTVVMHNTGTLELVGVGSIQLDYDLELPLVMHVLLNGSATQQTANSVIQGLLPTCPHTYCPSALPVLDSPPVTHR